MALVPSAWHAVQPPDFTLRIQSPWLFMFGLMPLPLSPVPGNSLFAGHLHQRQPVRGRVVLRRRARGELAGTALRSSVLPGAVCVFGESTSP